jgi:uncharacterized protein
MELNNEFVVNVPIEQAWATLTNLELIAPCMPGAQLQEVEGDVYRGMLKAKVGPILATFKGEAEFVSQDPVNYKAVVKGKGRETGGKGNADALITAQLESRGASTNVKVHTDLSITGKVAQFGRGALADISGKLIDQFAVNLETMVLNQPADGTTAVATTPVTTAAAEPADALAAPVVETATPAASDTSVSETVVSAVTETPAAAAAPAAGSGAAAASAAAGPTVRKIEQKEVAPLNVGSVARGAILKRLAPVGAAVVAAIVYFIVRN